MNSYVPSPVAHDLDGLTFPTHHHAALQVKHEYGPNPDFGFDPAVAEGNVVDLYPENANKLAHCVGFGRRNEPPTIPQDIGSRKYASAHRHSLSLPQLPQQNATWPPTLANAGTACLPFGSLSLNTKNLPNAASAATLYGQLTPPRSSSAISEPSKNDQEPARAISEQSNTKRRRSKAQSKNPPTPPQDHTTFKQKKNGGRKRATPAQLHPGNPEDDKRKASLEKNRVAAAKCRVNKKEKTEQLQRDSHTKAQANNQLRTLVETMEAERSTLAAYLAAHANCTDCRDPHHLKEALEMFQEMEPRARFPGLVGETLSANSSPVLSMSDQSMASGLYDDVGLTSTYSSMNPPLPDFHLTDEYDLHSPLPTG